MARHRDNDYTFCGCAKQYAAEEEGYWACQNWPASDRCRGHNYPHCRDPANAPSSAGALSAVSAIVVATALTACGAPWAGAALGVLSLIRPGWAAGPLETFIRELAKKEEGNGRRAVQGEYMFLMMRELATSIDDNNAKKKKRRNEDFSRLNHTSIEQRNISEQHDAQLEDLSRQQDDHGVKHEGLAGKLQAVNRRLTELIQELSNVTQVKEKIANSKNLVLTAFESLTGSEAIALTLASVAMVCCGWRMFWQARREATFIKLFWHYTKW